MAETDTHHYWRLLWHLGALSVRLDEHHTLQGILLGIAEDTLLLFLWHSDDDDGDASLAAVEEHDEQLVANGHDLCRDHNRTRH